MSSATVSPPLTLGCQAVRRDSGRASFAPRFRSSPEFTSVLNLAPEPAAERNLDSAERCKEGSQECDDDGEALGPGRNLDLERMLHRVGSGRLVGTWADGLLFPAKTFEVPPPPLPSPPLPFPPTEHRDNASKRAIAKTPLLSRVCARACRLVARSTTQRLRTSPPWRLHTLRGNLKTSSA